MPYLFDHLDLIGKAIKQPPCGLITDVDGTISHIAPTPQQAEVTPLCRQYLSILSQRLALVAAVSGRPAAEVKNMVGIDRMVYIGNHGLERWAEGHAEYMNDIRQYPRLVKTVIKELTRMLTIEGMRIEDKGITASIHYRLCADPKSAERDILTVLESLPQAGSLQIMPGKMAINLMPPVEANKGTATLELIREYNLSSGIYLGDDTTDIDGFRVIRGTLRDSSFQGLAIGVTSNEMPKELAAEADFTLNGVNDVERFLKWLSETAAQAS